VQVDHTQLLIDGKFVDAASGECFSLSFHSSHSQFGQKDTILIMKEKRINKRKKGLILVNDFAVSYWLEFLCDQVKLFQHWIQGQGK